MEEKKNKFLIKSYKQMFLVIGIFTLVLFVGGTTFAFFNYTRTGVANNIKTGRIYFNSTQNGTLNMTNIFPITSTQASSATLDTVTVGIVGDTTYADGEEFEITLTEINNTINGKQIPINYIATYTTSTGGNIGTSSNDYWNARNSKNADIYTLTETGSVEEGKQVLVGYIDNGATGINGTLSIKAYIDADRIAISDTYDSSNPGTDNMGTTSSWVNGRTVFTTTEWNSFQSSATPISFKIKAESNEGIWVEGPATPIPTIESCPGCKFIYTTNTYQYGGTNNANATEVLTLAGATDDYTSLNKNYFLGFTETNGKIDRAFACGIKGENPNIGTSFCLEGSIDGTTYISNKTFLNTLYGPEDATTGYGCYDPGDGTQCFTVFGETVAYKDGGTWLNGSDGVCAVYANGELNCWQL